MNEWKLWTKIWERSMAMAKSYHNWKSGKRGRVKAFSRKKAELHNEVMDILKQRNIPQGFRLRKSVEGTLTIEDYPNGYSIGLSNPDGDGMELANFLKKLKEGDELFIIKKQKR